MTSSHTLTSTDYVVEVQVGRTFAFLYGDEGGGPAIDGSLFTVNDKYPHSQCPVSCLSTKFGDGDANSNKTFSVLGGYFGDRVKWPSYCMTTLWMPPPPRRRRS